MPEDLKGGGLGGTVPGGAAGPARNHPRGLGGGSVDRDQQTNIFHLSVKDLGYPGEVHVQGRGEDRAPAQEPQHCGP